VAEVGLYRISFHAKAFVLDWGPLRYITRIRTAMNKPTFMRAFRVVRLFAKSLSHFAVDGSEVEESDV
jgi:hypothetical protein